MSIRKNTSLPHLRQKLLPWSLPLALVVLWQIAAQTGWLSSRVLPAPLDVLKAFWTLAVSGELWRHVLVSAQRALSGFAIGGGLGLLLGLATGSWKRVETLLDTTVQMIRNIPPLALIPLVILWFGIDETAKLFLVSLGVFFPVYINTFHGIRSVDAGLIEMGRSLYCLYLPRGTSGRAGGCRVAPWAYRPFCRFCSTCSPSRSDRTVSLARLGRQPAFTRLISRGFAWSCFIWVST